MKEIFETDSFDRINRIYRIGVGEFSSWERTIGQPRMDTDEHGSGQGRGGGPRSVVSGRWSVVGGEGTANYEKCEKHEWGRVGRGEDGGRRTEDGRGPRYEVRGQRFENLQPATFNLESFSISNVQQGMSNVQVKSGITKQVGPDAATARGRGGLLGWKPLCRRGGVAYDGAMRITRTAAG